jgi:hypothetical protein
MVTRTTYIGSFDQSVYQALNDQALRYAAEDPDTNWLPQAISTPIWAKTYKKPIYGASIGVQGSHDIGDSNIAMETPQNSAVYKLENVDGFIYYDADDLAVEGKYLPQRKAQEMQTWWHNVKQSIFKGVFTKGFSAAGAGQGNRLNEGIIEQATLVEDLDGANSALLAAGDVYKALTKMMYTIPSRIRQGRKVVIGVDDMFAFNARRALYRGATNQISEFDLFLNEFAPFVDRVVVSNDLFLNLVAGTTKTEADTLGTHSRIFMGVVGEGIAEQAYSFLGLVGEKPEPLIQGAVQRWTAKCAGCVNDVTGVLYSEQITWA